MLESYEKQSLALIFDRIRPEKLIGVIECLKECFENQYADDYSKAMINILSKTVNELQQIKK